MPRLSVRLDDQEAQALDVIRQDKTRSEAVRGLIKAGPTPRALPYSEFGVSGLSRFGGSIREEPLRELRGAEGRRMYEEMKKNNAVINAIFLGIENIIRQVKWFGLAASDKPEDVEAAEFLETCMHDMSFTWDDEILFILQMLIQGFSVLEVVYKLRQGLRPRKYIPDPAISQYDDGKAGWRKWAPRPASSLTPGNEWTFDEHGGLQAVNQTDPQSHVAIPPIPIEKALLFRTTPAPANSPEGISLLRGMYQAYYYSTNIAEIEGIGIERDLAGLPVIYLGRDCSFEGAKSDYQMAKDLVQNIRRDQQEGVVIPKAKMGAGAGEGQGILLELLSSSGGRQFDTSAIINRWDKKMAMTMLAQFIFLGMEKAGSYALSQTLGEYFNLAVAAWAGSIVEVINRYAVSRLFAMNTFTVDVLPKVAHSEVGVPDLGEVAKYINSLVGAQVITPDDALEDYMRAIAHFPDRQDTGSVAREPPKPPEEEEAEPGEEADEAMEEAEKGGWLRSTCHRWLAGEATRMVEGGTASERLDILGMSLVRLAKALDVPVPVFDLESLALGPGFVKSDRMMTAVARGLAVLAHEDRLGDLDVVSAGNIVLRRFVDLGVRERDSMKRAIAKRQREDDVTAMVEALG